MHSSGSSRARREETHRGTLSSVTCRRPQSADFNSAGDTISPACDSRNLRASSSLGGKWIDVSPRSRLPSGSSRRPPKEYVRLSVLEASRSEEHTSELQSLRH